MRAAQHWLTCPTLELRIGPAHEASLSVDAWRGQASFRIVNRELTTVLLASSVDEEHYCMVEAWKSEEPVTWREEWWRIPEVGATLSSVAWRCSSSVLMSWSHTAPTTHSRSTSCYPRHHTRYSLYKSTLYGRRRRFGENEVYLTIFRDAVCCTIVK